MRKPRALRPGDRIAIVAPASPLAREEFNAGVQELVRLGFVPVYDDDVFARDGYVAGAPALRAAALHRAWADPDVAGVIAVRGGYGSVQLLPLLDRRIFEAAAKAFIGYSDNTSLLTWLTLTCGVVTFHGPMLEGRLSRGGEGYDQDTFQRCLMRAAAVGALTHPALHVVRPGRAAGMVIGGTLTQLAASLGTPYAFMPPEGCILFLDEIGERPYRVDRLYTQLQQAGVIARAAAIVFNELPRCEEPGSTRAARDLAARLTAAFPGPVLYGLPSGHTDGATLTLPFGVRATVAAEGTPTIIIEEAAVW